MSDRGVCRTAPATPGLFNFHRIGPLGGFALVVVMFICGRIYICVSFSCQLFHQHIADYGPLQSSALQSPDQWDIFHQEIAGCGPLQSPDQWDRVLMDVRSFDKRRLQVIDLFRVLINERNSVSLIRTLKRSITWNLLMSRGTHGRCSTGGLVHSSTNS